METAAQAIAADVRSMTTAEEKLVKISAAREVIAREIIVREIIARGAAPIERSLVHEMNALYLRQE